MLTDRNKFTFVTIYCCISLINCSTIFVRANGLPETHREQTQVHAQRHTSNNGPEDVTVRNFSPRVDYNNEWRPVGRGDPLKNDPTYDYSPPTLDRVRYWADSSDTNSSNSKDTEGSKRKDYPTDAAAAVDLMARKANVGKNEILLLGATNERIRPATGVKQPYIGKNNKVEMPILQPKYQSNRRSYYSHQMPPTHLMPPPMQAMPSSSNIKSVHNEYSRHHMQTAGSYMGSSTMGMSSSHSKPYYSTAATSPWMHHSSSTVMHHRAPSAYDSHHQESINYLSYSKPSTQSSHYEGHSMNMNLIHSNQNTLKSNQMHRKPWLHELLQKEVVKTIKPTSQPIKYTVDTTKYIYESKPHTGTSSTYAPMVFLSPTVPSTIPPMPSTTSPPKFTYSTSPIYITSAATPFPTLPQFTTRTTATPVPTPERLLIPNTNNLIHRPTVAPMKTTDSLFKHYHQPNEPLIGPMYLIIEGHSKVKTYGKGELDPHRPKIVPIIPKREPIVRIADPNEKRGTIETFQVKHLHMKTASTTPLPVVSSPPNPTLSSSDMEVHNLSKVTLATTTTEKPLDRNDMSDMNMSASGMSDLFSFLNITLDSIFGDEKRFQSNQETNNTNVVTTQTTILVSSSTMKHDTTESPLTTDANDATTETAPREVRQVYDYDQLPNSRLKENMEDGFGEDEMIDDSWLTEESYDDNETNMQDDDEYMDDNNQEFDEET